MMKSEENCTLTAVGSFMKNVCFNETGERLLYFKCYNSNVYYKGSSIYSYKTLSVVNSVTSVCDNDPHMYQACGMFNTEITNTDVLCGGFFCDKRYVKCGENCKIDCSASQNNEDSAISLCNDKCDDGYGNCYDESDCNGYTYGINCFSFSKLYIPLKRICDGIKDCYDGEDDKNCNTTTYTTAYTAPNDSTTYTAPHTTLYTCTHYYYSAVIKQPRTVPIFNYTRCSVFDTTNEIYPYCLDYTDQTNCSDIERVGGGGTVLLMGLIQVFLSIWFVMLMTLMLSYVTMKFKKPAYHRLLPLNVKYTNIRCVTQYWIVLTEVTNFMTSVNTVNSNVSVGLTQIQN